MDKTKIYGIDLSHHNSEFDWDKLNIAVKIVFLKATQGAKFKDATMLPHVAKVRSNGLILGLYVFLNFTDTAQAQADNILSLGIDFSAPNTLPLIVDIENQVGKNDVESAALDKHIFNNPKDSARLIYDFLTIIEKETGRKPIIYTYDGFWKFTLHSPDFSSYPVWVANYTDHPPKLFGGWRDWAIWQYTDRGGHSVIPPLHTLGDKQPVLGDVDWSIVNPNIDLKTLANIK
jgi:lysozyme